MELALDAEARNSGPSYPKHVSILVFVELALDVQADLAITSIISVSILVFVELALDASSASVQAAPVLTGFNPCFRGTCS